MMRRTLSLNNFKVRLSQVATHLICIAILGGAGIAAFAEEDTSSHTKLSPGRAIAADLRVQKLSNGTIEAIHTYTGDIVASGDDASDVIQAAIDSLPVTGGKIYIGAGSYKLTRTIKIEDKHGVHLEGASRGIVFSQGQEGTVLRSNKAIDLIEIFGNKNKIAGVTVSDLHLIGSGKQNGI